MTFVYFRILILVCLTTVVGLLSQVYSMDHPIVEARDISSTVRCLRRVFCFCCNKEDRRHDAAVTVSGSNNHVFVNHIMPSEVPSGLHNAVSKVDLDRSPTSIHSPQSESKDKESDISKPEILPPPSDSMDYYGVLRGIVADLSSVYTLRRVSNVLTVDEQTLKNFIEKKVEDCPALLINFVRKCGELGYVSGTDEIAKKLKLIEE